MRFFFSKFLIALRGGHCYNAHRASWSLATFTGIGQTSSICARSHLCPPQTKCPVNFSAATLDSFDIFRLCFRHFIEFILPDVLRAIHLT